MVDIYIYIYSKYQIYINNVYLDLHVAINMYIS